MKELVIVGKGPAGISCALYTARAGIKTTIIGRDLGALQKAHLVENYWGFAEPVDAKKLVENGILQATRLGCTILTDEVVGIGFDQKLEVMSKTGNFSADAVLLATGANRSRPNIEGLAELEGLGVSYCAVCDAFFHRTKPVCVIGSGDYALHEAMELIPIVGSVTVLTNGTPPTAQFPPEVTVDTRRIMKLQGGVVLESVVFEDGAAITVSGAFVAVGTASSSDLARKLGAKVADNRIVVDSNMATNIPALYAAGDCIGGLLQIAKAVSDGAIAGTAIVRQLRK